MLYVRFTKYLFIFFIAGISFFCFTDTFFANRTLDETIDSIISHELEQHNQTKKHSQIDVLIEQEIGKKFTSDKRQKPASSTGLDPAIHSSILQVFLPRCDKNLKI